MIARFALSLGLVLGLTGAASAQQWAANLFTVKSHDFGTVPRAARAEYEFEFTNTTGKPMRLSAVRASCGCTTPSITREVVPPGEKGSVKAVFNTRNFTGDRAATLTLTITEPQYAEVQLRITGYVRRDVVLDPAQVDFGSVHIGSPAEQVVKINYAGRSDWKLTGVQSNSKFVTGELKETRREGQNISYDLKVKLSETAGAGYFSLPLNLKTNDNRLETLQVIVEGRIVSPVTLSPESLSLGALAPGQVVEKKLIIRADREFKVTGFESNNPALTLELPTDAKKMHVIPIRFTAGANAERIACEVILRTDLDGATATFKAYATVEAGVAKELGGKNSK